MALLHEVGYLPQIKMCDKPVLLSRALVLFALSRLSTAKWNSFEEGWWNGGVAEGWGLYETQLSSVCKNEGILNVARRGSYPFREWRTSHVFLLTTHLYGVSCVAINRPLCFCSHVVLALYCATFGTWRLYKSVFWRDV